ncbi:hypothetical protein ACIQ7Q_26615 [Streptomyces sp. NPDC096176]|uniref:hypothetical protein n=1 Tax=Streptomyces sp. NPDC096176 TaxID=3366079 RepID=UPI0038043EDC
MRPPRFPAVAALVLLVVAGCVTGCVSVPAAPPAPAPSLAPAGERSPLPAERSLPVQPSAREALASTGPKAKRKKERKPKSRPVRRQRPAAAPPRAEPAAPVRRAQSPEHRVQRPRPQQPRPPQPDASYDMSSLCEASDGVTDPNITALCHSYGSRGR